MKARNVDDAGIREAQTRTIAAMLGDPDACREVTVTKGVIEDGLACQISQGDHRAVTDLGPGMGGSSAGPSPSFYARAGIAGCVAIAVKMLAAREAVAFRRVEVSVMTDMDDLGLFGYGTCGAAPVETRVRICIDSEEDADVVSWIVTRALEMDPWYLALKNAQNVTPRLSLRGEEHAL